MNRGKYAFSKLVDFLISRIKVCTLFDVVFQILVHAYITEAKVHDLIAMDDIPYKPYVLSIIDKGYYDLASRVLTDKTPIRDFLITRETIDDDCAKTPQLEFAFRFLR